jgi:phosphatidylserine/phosphatidylglycerophosphate/cardiolipin synthase-like enzyme
MELNLKDTDSLNSGVFVINDNRTEFGPFVNYKEVYLTQEGNAALKNEVLEIIREAKSVLKICSFIITDEEVFTAILTKAKETQVAVFILTQLDPAKLENSISLVDFITEEELKEIPSRTHLKYVKHLYDNGIHVRASLSAHSKFIVSDRARGFITSANFTTPSLTFNTESGIYLDENSSKELDKLFDIIFLQGTTYKQFIGTRKKGKMLVVQSEVRIDSKLLPQVVHSKLRFTCESYSDNLLREIIDMFNEAKQYVFLSTYSIVGLSTLPDLVKSIKSAIGRGVSVSVFCRGMNYRSDHLLGATELYKIGCKVYGDLYNHSKGIINEHRGVIFTANIDGHHGLTNGFEVGYIINEDQRLEFLDFHKRLIETAFYVFDSKPTRKVLFETYSAYERIKGLSPPSFPKSLIVLFKQGRDINFDEFKENIIFYGRLKETEFLIVGSSYYRCRLKDDIISVFDLVKPRFDLEKYVLKFAELKIGVI